MTANKAAKVVLLTASPSQINQPTGAVVPVQQGRWEKADEILRLKLNDMRDVSQGSEGQASKANRRVWRYYERMAGASVIESGRWKLAETFAGIPREKPNNYARATLAFARGFSSAMRDSRLRTNTSAN